MTIETVELKYQICLFHLRVRPTFSVTPSKVKVRGGSMTTSRQGITMTARLRSPTFQRISVIAEHSESFCTVSAGSSRDFLGKTKLFSFHQNDPRPHIFTGLAREGLCFSAPPPPGLPPVLREGKKRYLRM